MYLFSNKIKFSQLRSTDNEKGIYLLIVAGSLFALMAIVGFAIDSGTLYQNEIYLKRATDAATVAGSAILALNEKTFCDTSDDAPLDDKVAVTIERTIDENLRFNGIGESLTRGNQINQYDFEIIRENCADPSPEFMLQVRAKIEPKLILMPIIPGLDFSLTVNSISQSLIKPTVVTLILDTSGSMNCEDQATSVICSSTTLPNSKLAALKTTVTQDFIPAFDNGRDFLSIISFNRESNIAYTKFPLSSTIPNNPPGGYNKNSAINVVNALVATNSTNMASAFASAGAVTTRLLNTPGMEDLEAAYVFFSDGAPTAAEFKLTDSPLGELGTYDIDDNLIPNTQNRDTFFLWSVNWANSSTGQSLGVGLSQLSNKPSACVPLYGKACGYDTNCNPSVSACLPPKCSTLSSPYSLTSTNTNLPTGGAPKTLENGADEFAACFPRFKFDILGSVYPKNIEAFGEGHLASGTGSAVIGKIKNGEPDTFLYQFFTASIAWADELRARRGIWFAVGFGKDPDGTEDLPYEGLEDSTSRRDNLMNRIALASLPPGNQTRHYDFPGVELRENLFKNYQHEIGEHFPVTRNQDLSRIFKSISAKIKLRNIKPR